MELHLPIYMIALILVVGVTYNTPVWVSSSSVTPQMYWKNVFPNTPMPTAIKSSLQTVGKQGKEDPFRASLIKTNIEYTKAATQKEVEDYLNKYGETYMLEAQMIPGRIIQVRLRTHADNKATFLPSKDSDSIPFSSDKLTEILKTFSIQPISRESVAIEETINNCEQPYGGEDKLCTTSLQAMISFVKSKLGDGVSPTSSTSVSRDGKIKYKIVGVKTLTDYGSLALLCHKVQYPYAVFSCHQVEMTTVYLVSMVGDGIGVEAATVCHKDTSWWSPKHVSFQLLKAKPGKTTPVCHFLDDLSIVWTKK